MEHRLLSIRKAPAGSFRRFVQTPRRQPRLRPIRAQSRDQFHHYHQSLQPPDGLSQIMQAFSSSIPHFESLEWRPIYEKETSETDTSPGSIVESQLPHQRDKARLRPE